MLERKNQSSSEWCDFDSFCSSDSTNPPNNLNGVFLQSTLNLAESYNPEQIVEKNFKLKFQCKTYVSKEKKVKFFSPFSSQNNAE